MVMGNAKSTKKAAGCRRHRQAGAGVCAFCLQERLSRLALSSSLPSVVRGCDDEEGASSCCSEASTAYTSDEGSTGCSSAAESPSGRASPGFFRDEARRTGRVSLLMRHERVVGDADAVAAFLQARREQRRAAAAAANGFWAKLLRAARGGGATRRQQDDGCSLAHSKSAAVEERVSAVKWVLF